MKKKYLFMAVALIVVVAVLLGLTLFRKNKNGAVKYRQDILAKGDIEALVVTTGTVNPVSLVEVGSQVSGRIAKLYVDFNTPVKQGQVLAELDQSILKSKIDQNKANYLSAAASLEGTKVTLDNLRNKYERSLSLFDKNLISFEEKEAAEANYLSAKTDVQSAEARVAQARSQLEASQVDLGYAIIRSPIDGIVILRNINIGQTVAASFQAPVLFQIANDLNKMQIECSVDEADIGRVKEGQGVRFNVDAFPEEAFHGVMKQVRYSPEVQQNVVTYTTIAEVDNPEMKLRPGMTATVSIITGEAKDVLRIPNVALRFTPDLAAEEMQKIMREAGEQMTVRHEQAKEGRADASPPDRLSSSPRREGAGSMTQPFSQGGGLSSQGMRKPASRVWIQDKTGRLRVVFIRTGVSDSSFTEMVRGDLQEGQNVLVGSGPGNSSPGQASSARAQRMMFTGR